jgi:hypothetical protein
MYGDFGSDQYTSNNEITYGDNYYKRETRHDFNNVMKPLDAKPVTGPEDKFMASQQGIPAYVINCQCTRGCKNEYLPGVMAGKESMIGGKISEANKENIIVFLLFVIIYLCYSFGQTLQKINSRIKKNNMATNQ